MSSGYYGRECNKMQRDPYYNEGFESFVPLLSVVICLWNWPLETSGHTINFPFRPHYRDVRDCTNVLILNFFVSESLFSSATGYTFASPTPPPGSPYSPVAAATQLELLAKSFNSNIIIQQQPDYPLSPRKRCDEKCFQVEDDNQFAFRQDLSVLKFKSQVLISGCVSYLVVMVVQP